MRRREHQLILLTRRQQEQSATLGRDIALAAMSHSLTAASPLHTQQSRSRSAAPNKSQPTVRTHLNVLLCPAQINTSDSPDSPAFIYMKCEMCRSTADQRCPLNTDFLLSKDKYIQTHVCGRKCVSFCLCWQTNYKEIKAGVDISNPF